MCNGLEKRPDAALEPLMKTSCPPVMPELDLSANTTKIPLSDLSTLGDSNCGFWWRWFWAVLCEHQRYANVFNK